VIGEVSGIWRPMFDVNLEDDDEYPAKVAVLQAYVRKGGTK
jgi:hypothetical protein